MKHSFGHSQRLLLTVASIGLFIAVLAGSAFPTKYFASAAALPFVQATTCPPPNLQLAKQITLDAGAEHFFAPGDFNGDGKQDLVVQTSVGKIYTLLGDGAGNLATASTLTLPTGGPRTQISSGDFNGDGRLDVITLSTARLEMYLNNGNGALTIGNSFAVNAAGFLLGDFNEDGKTDIAVTLRCCPDGVVIYLSNASGFTATSFPWGASRVSAVADFNGDGNLDVLTSDSYYPSSQVRLGNGRGQFMNGEYLYYDVQVFYFAATDFNKDGKVDVLGYTAQNRVGQDVANSRKLIVLSGDGAGRFTASYPSAPLDAIRSDSIAADFTGDGFPDIATRATNIFTNNGSGGLCAAFPVTTAQANRVSAADFNGDGKAELIRQAGTVEIWTSGGGTTNTPPTITLNPTTIPQGVKYGFYFIGSVSDAETPVANLSFKATNLPAGLSLSTEHLSNGYLAVRAQLPCNEPLRNVSVPITVTDGNGASTTAILALTIGPNQPPSPATYLETTLNRGLNEIYPTGVWGDDSDDLPQLSMVSTNYGGSITVDNNSFPAFGVVRITYNSVPGRYQATIRATDNCGLTASTNIVFTIPTPPTSCATLPASFSRSLDFGINERRILATADFNRDGTSDIAFASASTNRILIYFNTATSSGWGLTQRANLAVGTTPSSVTVADLNNDNWVDLIVANEGSDNLSILLGTGSGDFSAATNYAVGRSPRSAGVGDFNSDGKPDIAVANSSSNSFSILPGNGAGGFGGVVTISRGVSQDALAVGDFNGDNRSDLAVCSLTSNSVAIHLGRGDGSFTYQREYAVGQLPYDIKTGEFTGDGKTDLVIANSGSNHVSLLTGDGAGAFSEAKNFSTGRRPYTLTTGDFNSDGKLDLVTGNLDSRSISVLLGTGAGAFNAATHFAMDGEVFSVAAADFNKDGKLDLAGSHHQGSTTFLLNNFTCTQSNTPPTIVEWIPRRLLQGFAASLGIIGTVTDAETPASNLQISASNLPTGVTLTNLRSNNGSVTGDLIISCAAPTGTYQIPLRVTDGGGLSTTANWALTIDANQPPSLGTYPNTTVNSASGIVTPTRSPSDDYEIRSVTVRAPTYGGSLNLSPQGVVTITNNNVAGTHVATITATDNCGLTSSTSFTFTIVPVNNCESQIPLFAAPVSFPTDGDVTDLATGDFNNDGRLDVVGVNFSAITLSVLYNDGRGGFFVPPRQLSLASGRGSVASGDLNRDGNLDFVASNIFSNTVSVLLGRGNNDFQLGVQYPAGEVPNDLALGDFNSDGRLDVVVKSAGANRLSVLLGNGNGGLGSPTNFVAPTIGGGQLAVADFNRDNRLDVAVTGPDANKVSVLLGDGAGRLSLTVDYPVAIASEISTGDLNRDGIPDLVVLEKSDPNYSVVVMIGRGDGTFQAATRYPTTNAMFDLALGDINGDGLLDILVSLATPASNLVIFPGNGNGTFRPGVAVNAGAFPGNITTGDFNGDGRLDVMARNNTFGVTLLRNEGTCTTNTNTPPKLTLEPLTPNQGVTFTPFIGAVSDAETPLNLLQVSASNVPAGISITNLQVDNTGAVKANLQISCTMPLGAYQIPIRVTDSGGLSATGNLAPTVQANQPPFLGAYPATTVSGSSVQVTPITTPGDDGGTPTVTVAAASYAGSLSIAANGVVTIINNNVAGSYVATVTATDNCGLKISTSFTFTIPPVTTGCPVPTFNASQSYSANNRPYGLASGDFNGDGRIDLVTTNLWDNTVTILLANASGFTKQTPIAVGVLPNYIVARDLNGDSKLDLVVVNRGSDTVTILLGNGNGTFTKKGDYTVGNKSTGVMIGDFNVDGKLDLLLPNDGLGNVAVLNGNGDGSFQPLRFFFAGGSPQPGVVGDFNGDGRDDVVLPNYFAGSVILMFGSPSGSLTSTAYTGNLGGPGVEAIAKGDLNGDGKLDLVITNTTTNHVFTILGDGTGGFTSGGGFATFSDYPASIVLTDFTGDGKADIAVGGYNNNRVHIFKGLGNGFDNNTPLVIGVGAEPLSLLTNDFNGDGKADLAIANTGSGTMSVLLNACGQ